jgi:HJR/Mrr/RecB family endonuclease
MGSVGKLMGSLYYKLPNPLQLVIVRHMARRYYRRRRRSSPSGAVILIGLLVVAWAYNSLSAEDINQIATYGIALTVAIFAIALFIKFKLAQRQKRKLRALELIDTEYMDGLAFEKYVAELLKGQGFSKVTLTERYDYGIDIIALKDGVRWGVQVKRHSNMVKAEAVRQVVTALNKYNCQRAMVVTNSTFSRPARVLAESNNCVLIGKDELAEWIIAFQEGK